jgi:naphthalene 1,2-dioxygenase ferredoxin reductase component
VLEGQVLHQGHELRHPALHLQRPGSVLACQTVVTGHCSIRLPELDEVVVHPARTLKAVVTSIDELNAAVKRLRLRSARPLSFSAGQYAMLQFASGLARPYSMAESPAARELEFHIARIPGGLAGSHVFNNLRAGDIVRVSGPLGVSFLRHNDPRPIICVAAGAGLAPVLSLLREASRRKMPNVIHVYVVGSAKAGPYGADLARSIAAQVLNARIYIVSFSGRGRDEGQYRLVTDAIETEYHDLSNWRGYFFGVPAVVESATMLAKRLGMDCDRVHADAFYPAGL